MTISQPMVVGVIAVTLLVQLAASYSLGVLETDRGTPQFSLVPRQISSWTMESENKLEPIILAYLQPDDYILRDYRLNGHGSVNLFAAYFKSLQNTYGPHSPRVCLPGSGWLVRDSATIPIKVHDGTIEANQYVMEKVGERILVIYWYQNSRRSWAQEFHAKLYLLPDLLRYRQSDATLVRLVAPLGKGQSGELNQQLAIHPARSFAGLMYPFVKERLGSMH
jgi:EpsI family protein